MIASALSRDRRARSQPARKICLKGAALAYMCAMLQVAAHAAEAVPPSVLILYSNQRPLPANVMTDDTLRRVVPQLLERPIEIFSEFLDVEHFSGQEYAEAMADFIRRKYSGSDIRVIVAPGPGALAFTLKYRNRMIPDVPVVHLQLTRETLHRFDVPPDVVGWTVDFDVAPTLVLALHLHPNANRIVLVSGASPQDRAWEGRYRQALAKLEKPARVEFLAGLATPDLLERLHALSNDAIVFTPGYFLDGAGRVSTPRQSVDQMVQASAAPIYGPYDSLLGSGVVGGYMVLFENQATRAGELVAKLLAGTAPTAISTGELPNVPILDWRQIRHWGIDESALPADSVVLFREPSVLIKYQWQIAVIAAALLVQSLLIAALFVQRRRRRQAERVAQQQQLELAHAQRLATVGEMTAAISHEINQPLGAILSNADAAEMMLEANPASAGDLRQILADIRRDDLRASAVVRRIRALLQKHDVEKEVLDLNTLILDTVPLVGAEAERRGVDIDVLPAPVPLRVHGDRIQLQQLLLNLIMNAMDAMADTPTVFRRVTLGASLTGGRTAEIDVIDSGHGIQAEAKEHLFDSFFTTKPRGLGLGLSIARTIAEAHGGRLRAENNASRGATFRLTLPIAEPIPVESPAPLAQAPASSSA